MFSFNLKGKLGYCSKIEDPTFPYPAYNISQ